MFNEKIDCIVRFHDLAYLDQLQRCVFSLIGQNHRPLNIILALQRFSDSEIAETRKALEPILDLDADITLKICNYKQPMPTDARSELLNLSLQAAQGRYVAFLDYDDVLYPEAYSKLLMQMHEANAAIAFASIRVVKVEVFKHFIHVVEEVKEPFGKGSQLIDLFESPFCPIHSFLIDRLHIDPADLKFEADLTLEEDYDFLLRICSKYRSDFTLVGTKIGDYYWKNDGSNSIGTVFATPEKVKAYEGIREAIEKRRLTTFVCTDVQDKYGIPPLPTLSIREFIERVRGQLK